MQGLAEHIRFGQKARDTRHSSVQVKEEAGLKQHVLLAQKQFDPLFFAAAFAAGRAARQRLA